MKKEHEQEIIETYFENIDVGDSKILVKNIRLQINNKCTELKHKNKLSHENILLTICIFLGISLGSLFAFADIIDFASEVFEFVGLTILIIAMMTTGIFIAFKYFNDKNIISFDLKGRTS